MIRRHRHLIVGISSILFVSFLLSCATSPGEIDGQVESSLKTLMKMEPVPELSPEEVVEIQLTALKTNDQRDNGIELAYRFTSTRNQRLAGNVTRFAEIIRRESYSPMFNHVEYDLGPVETKNEVAIVAVNMVLPDGNITGYVFVLKQQEGGEYDECWMTEGVVQIVTDAPTAFEMPETRDA